MHTSYWARSLTWCLFLYRNMSHFCFSQNFKSNIWIRYAYVWVFIAYFSCFTSMVFSMLLDLFCCLTSTWENSVIIIILNVVSFPYFFWCVHCVCCCFFNFSAVLGHPLFVFGFGFQLWKGFLIYSGLKSLPLPCSVFCEFTKVISPSLLHTPSFFLYLSIFIWIPS